MYLYLYSIQGPLLMTPVVPWIEIKSYYNIIKSRRSVNKESHWKPVKRGAPQGYILGPLVFSIYIDDVIYVTNHYNFYMYGDDLQIYCHYSITDLPGTVTNMNDDIDAIGTLAFEHGLKPNEKTKKCWFRKLQ